MTAVWIALALVVVSAGCSQVYGWWITYRRDGYPFGWRVLLGPAAYMEWVKRRAARLRRR